MRFARPKVDDQWRYLTYTLRGVKLDEKRGGTCMVRWPDGTKERIVFASVPRLVTVSDMGSTYQGQAYDLVAQVEHHGMWVSVPLEALSIADIEQSESTIVDQEPTP